MSPFMANNTANEINSENTCSVNTPMHFVGVYFNKLVQYSQVEKK